MAACSQQKPRSRQGVEQSSKDQQYPAVKEGTANADEDGW